MSVLPLPWHGRFLLGASLAIFGIATWADTQSSGGENPLPEPARRPNIVLLMADDLGFSDLGCYGGEIDTPNLDRLAAEGLCFTRFYNNALCGPTRASLLTGLYPQQIGLRGDLWTGRRQYDRCLTLGEALQFGGYHTMMVGKWQDLKPASDRGFDRSLSLKAVVPISYFNEITHDSFYLNGKLVHPPSDDYFLTDWITDHAVEFLKEAVEQENPFFLYGAYVAPHWPLHAREEHIERFRSRYRKQGWDDSRQARFDRQVKSGLAEDSWTLSPAPEDVHGWKEDRHQEWQAERMAVYAAQVYNLDRNMGRILAVLDEAGVAKDTLVVFLSDNGAAKDGGLVPTKEPFSKIVQNPKWRIDGGAMRPGSHAGVLPGPGDTFAAYGHAWANLSNTPFRNFKWTALEGGINTPVIIRWPRVVKSGGEVTRALGHVMDLMPTFLELAGVSYPLKYEGRKPLPLEGQSLVPILNGQILSRRTPLFWYGRSRAVRDGKWKLVSQGLRSEWELYDMEQDPVESVNLAKRFPDRVEELSVACRLWSARVNLNVPGLFGTRTD